MDRAIVFLKDWSYLRFLEVAGILLSILIIIPSAEAVDALKTCACLLKECRYVKHSLPFNFPLEVCFQEMIFPSSGLVTKFNHLISSMKDRTRQVYFKSILRCQYCLSPNLQ